MRKALRFDGNCEAFVIAVALRAVSLQASPWPWLQSVNAPSRCLIWCARKSVMRPRCSRASVAPSWVLTHVGFDMMPPKVHDGFAGRFQLAAHLVVQAAALDGAAAERQHHHVAHAGNLGVKCLRGHALAEVDAGGGTSNRTESYASPCDVFCGCAGRLRRLGAEGPQPRFAVRRSLACGLSVATGSNNRSSVRASEFTSITFFLLPTSANRSPTL